MSTWSHLNFTRQLQALVYISRDIWANGFSIMAAMTVEDISEHLPPQRTRTLSFYVAFFFCVLPVWSAVPLAWSFASYSIYTDKWWSYGPLGRALFFVACCEVCHSRCHVSFLRSHLYGRAYSASTIAIWHGGCPNAFQIQHAPLKKLAPLSSACYAQA